MASIDTLITETNNPATAGISGCSTLEMVRLINQEDKKVAQAVERELPHIAEAIDEAAARLARGGPSVLCRRGDKRSAGRGGRQRMPLYLWRFTRYGAGRAGRRIGGHWGCRAGR